MFDVFLTFLAFHFGAEEPGSGGQGTRGRAVPQGTRGREAFLKALLKAKQRRQPGDTAARGASWRRAGPRQLGFQGFREDIALEHSKNP